MSPAAPQQQHCSSDMSSARDSVTPTTTIQAYCQTPSSPVHTSPISDAHPHPAGPLQTFSPAGAGGPPSEMSQPQSHTQATSSVGPSVALVNGSSPTRESHAEVPKHTSTTNPTSSPAPSSPQPGPSSMDGSPVSDAPVPGFATLGRRLMLSGSDPHNHLNHTHGPPHHNYQASTEHSAAVDTNKRPCYSPHTPQSYSSYTTISIPLPHPQPPLPEKRHLPGHLGSPSNGVKPAVGHVPASTAPQHQHHVTFSPTVGEIAPPADQNDQVEAETANGVSVKFVQDSSKFWYKPSISREQGKLFSPYLFLFLQKPT